jgi:hypothetical protein
MASKVILDAPRMKVTRIPLLFRHYLQATSQTAPAVRRLRSLASFLRRHLVMDGEACPAFLFIERGEVARLGSFTEPSKILEIIQVHKTCSPERRPLSLGCGVWWTSARLSPSDEIAVAGYVWDRRGDGPHLCQGGRACVRNWEVGRATDPTIQGLTVESSGRNLAALQKLREQTGCSIFVRAPIGSDRFSRASVTIAWDPGRRYRLERQPRKDRD